MKENLQSSSGIPLIIFLFSITVTLISFGSIIFPAILSTSDISNELGMDRAGPEQFEIGVWGMPVLVTNGIVFLLFLAYKKKRIPKNLKNYLQKLFNFEISRKVSLIVMIVLLAIYVSASANELGTEEKWSDYQGVKSAAQGWNISWIVGPLQPHVAYFFLQLSLNIFGNMKVIPFLASIALLIVTYFLTKKITQKRFAGIVAVVILMQSNLFLSYDTSVAYSNFWTLFYVLSLYLVYRVWPISPISYIASILAKSLTAIFLPMSVFFILRTDVPRRTRLIIVAATSIIVIAGGIVAISGADVTSAGEAKEESFDAKEFWQGFTSFSHQIRFDGLVILFMIPLMVGLFIASKNGIRHADSMMVMISGMLLIAPILTGFTNLTNQPYRFVPMIVFFAIGVGILLSKKTVDNNPSIK